MRLALYFNGNLNDLYESFESKVDTFISRREQERGGYTWQKSKLDIVRPRFF